MEIQFSNQLQYLINSFNKALEIANFIFKKQDKIFVYHYEYDNKPKLADKKAITSFLHKKADKFGEKEYQRFCCFEPEVINLSSLL